MRFNFVESIGGRDHCLANKSDTGADGEFPFQNLMFVIRVLTTPYIFDYGLTGGQEFFKHKLNNTNKSTVKQFLRESTGEIKCFLMPNIGSKAEEKDFNGSIDELRVNFAKNLNEFFLESLDSNKIMPKMINNKTITANEFLQYFKVYFELFNSKEQPKYPDIIEARTKTSDIILIDSLKKSHSEKLMAFTENEDFIPRNVLQTFENEIKNKTITDFNRKKKSKFIEIIKELNELLEKKT